MIKVKRGASIQGCRPEILLGLIAIDPIFAQYGVDTVVTSGTEDYKHSATRSRHYCGDAIDVRSKHLPNDKKTEVYNKIKRKLGKDYVVILEGRGKSYEHFHIHWAPTYPFNAR